MPVMVSTERIFLHMERPGYPFDIAAILLLDSSPDGPIPFEQVRALFRQRCHRSAPMTRVVAPAPLEGLDGGAVIFESTVDSRSPWMRAGFRSGGQVRLTGELVERGLVCVGRGAQLRRPGRCGIDEFCQGSS